jgi:hypothetical protein
VKTTIIALSAAALVAAASTAPAQSVPGQAPGPQHTVSKKHHAGASGYARPRQAQARGAAKGYPGAIGYAPGESHGYLDRGLEVSGRQAGGGNM